MLPRACPPPPASLGKGRQRDGTGLERRGRRQRQTGPQGEAPPPGAAHSFHQPNRSHAIPWIKNVFLKRTAVSSASLGAKGTEAEEPGPPLGDILVRTPHPRRARRSPLRQGLRTGFRPPARGARRGHLPGPVPGSAPPAGSARGQDPPPPGNTSTSAFPSHFGGASG